jgi:hypothetical protein
VTAPAYTYINEEFTTDWAGVTYIYTTYYNASYQPVYPTVVWKWQDNNTAVTGSDLAYIQANAYIYSLDVGRTYEIAVPIYASIIRMTDNTRSPVRMSVYSPVLAEGVYDVRVKRASADEVRTNVTSDVYLSDINEIVLEDIGYRNTGLLALRIKLTDQLNSLPSVSYRVWGKVLNVYNPTGGYWAYTYSENPAWIVWDILTSTRYGGGIHYSRLDFDKWVQWAQYCTFKGLTFNGIIDRQMTVWDAAQLVARCGHATLVPLGTKYSIAMEADNTPVQVFSVANIEKESFKINWLPMDDRANEIEVTYYDRADKYRQRSIRLYDQIALSQGRSQKTASVDLVGVVDYTRAAQEAQFHLNLNRYITQTVEFDARVEAIACTIGDVIIVQHDMPQWGFGGRFSSTGNLSTVTLDRTVTMETNKTYSFLTFFDTVTRVTGTIASISGNWVTLNGYSGQGSIKRFVAAGTLDKEVKSFSVNAVYLDNVSGLSAGQSYVLYDTDVIEQRYVQLAIGTTNTITLTAPLPDYPRSNQQWLFGEYNKVRKPFKVKSLSRGDDYKRTIVALEHNASVYDLSGIAVPTPNYSNLQTTIKQSTITSVAEDLIAINGIIRSQLTVYFNNTSSTYRLSRVYASVNGGAETYKGSGEDRITFEVADRTQITVRVVAEDALGKAVPASSAPTYTLTVLGKSAPPKDVIGFGHDVDQYGIALTWSANTDVDIDSYEVRYGNTWDTATILVSKHRSTILTTGLRSAGTHTFWIKAIDTTGNYSTNAVSTQAVIIGTTQTGLNGSFAGENVVLTWAYSVGAFALDRFEIRTGASWAAGTLVSTTKSTGFSEKANFSSSKTYWVAAIDIAGNISTATSVTLTIVLPSAPSVTVEVIDNNVLLRWTTSTASLPINRYILKKGATLGAAVEIGQIYGQFSAIFEQNAGTYIYWVAGIDSAGNVGSYGAVSALVSAPPDYILRQDWVSSLGGTRSNIQIIDGVLTGPLATQTFAEHFTNNSWATPQAQIDAGYPNYFQPSATTSYYEETFDYGTTITQTTLISVSSVVATITGTVTKSTSIWTSADNTNWSTEVVGEQLLKAGFRYVKTRVTVTATGGDDLYRLLEVRVKLSLKQKTDSGVATVNDTDSGGTTVNFNVSFKDVDSITLTALGTTVPLIAIYDFTDTPDPTSFKILLYDRFGTRQDGTVSWSARGV